MDRRELITIRKALTNPPLWMMFVGLMIVLVAIAKGSVWAAPLGIIIGSMAGERDASRRVSAALRSLSPTEGE